MRLLGPVAGRRMKSERRGLRAKRYIRMEQKMRLHKIHRRVACAVAEAAMDIDAIARSFGLTAKKVRKWLCDPEMRKLIRQKESEHGEQMRRLALRYGPAATIRLIHDLGSENASEARQAALAIVKLACTFSAGAEAETKGKSGPDASDAPLSISPEQSDRILEILASDTRAGEATKAQEQGEQT